MDFIPNPLLMPGQPTRGRRIPLVFGPMPNPIGLLAGPLRPVTDVDEELAFMRWCGMEPLRNPVHRRLLVENVLRRRRRHKENKKPDEKADSRMRSLVASAGHVGGQWSSLTKPLR